MNRVEPMYGWMLIAVSACTVTALTVSLQTGVLALLFAIFSWWVWLHPEQAFRFFIILAPLLPMFKMTQTVGNITLVKDVLILTLFLRTFLWPLATKTLPYRRNILFAPLVALLGWTLLSFLQADSIALGILRSRDIILYIVLYFAVLYLPHSKEIMRERLQWFGASAAVVLLLAIYQWFFAIDSAVLRFDPIASIWIPRISSTFGHPTVFGEYLTLLATLATAGVMFTYKRTRILSIVSLLILLIFIYLTYSRGVWIGLVGAWGAMGVTYIIHTFRERISRQAVIRLTKYILLILLALGALLTFTPAGNFLRATLDARYTSNAIRLDFAARLIAPMTNTEAIIGRGLGDVTQQIFRDTEISGNDIVTGSSRNVQLSKDSTLVDNQYLKTFVEMGLIGLLIYAWIYIRVYRSAQEPTLMNYWVIGFISSFIIGGLFVDIWDVFPSNAIFWILIALHSATVDIA